MNNSNTAHTPGLFSVVSGKVMRETSTARIEVLPREATTIANGLLAALERASACMARIGSHVPANERDTFTATHDAVYAAIKQARGEQ